MASTKKTTVKPKSTKAKKVAERAKKPKGKLVIVESPAKARTISNFLGKEYVVKASKGHVRDLLVTQLSVDVENDFEPKYRVPNDKREIVKELKNAVDNAAEVYLATDPDREGEAIAWHLVSATEMDLSRAKRVVFHEITKPAIQHAFEQTRDINMNLVNAQQARRILDRLVGYNLTELLWDRVRNRLSAGRVQSIAVRLVVDREREVEAFVPEEYWTIDAELRKQGTHSKADGKPFLARLLKFKGEDITLSNQGDVLPHLEVLERSIYRVADIKRGVRQRKPSAPFTTSTLQQEASRRLGFTARRTMNFAQQLYEGIDLGDEGSVGLITYMRTDSLTVSEQAQAETRDYVIKRFGKTFAPDKPPVYKTKTKGAQEAHEAIRPTNVLRVPDAIKQYLSRDQFKLYKLIWERFVASQMTNAVYNTLRVDIAAGLSKQDQPYTFRVSGSTIKFAGFLALYEDARDEDLAEDSDEGRILPEFTVEEMLDFIRLLPEQHFTQPPPRYTEASLVRTLEEYGIGRPSTYAPTVAVIQNRDYVTKEGTRLIPTETGRIVNDLLVKHFPEIIDYQFTARMEDELDEIADGGMEWRPMLQEFYDPFEGQLAKARDSIERIQTEEPIGRTCPTCNEGQLLIKYGRFGKFIGCSRYPDCRHTEPWLERTGITCPICGEQHGGEIIERKTRKGRTFYGCSRYPECDYSAWKLPEGARQTNAAGVEADEEAFESF